MFEISKIQTVIATLAVTLVVVATIGFLLQRSTDDVAGDASQEPTVVPVLERPRMTWYELGTEVSALSATTAPVDCPIIDERNRDSRSFLSVTPALTFVCGEATNQVAAIAPGRVVMKVNQPLLNSFKAELIADRSDGPWVRAAAYGPFVVVDHGPSGEVRNLTSIYAGLGSIDERLQLGQLVVPGTPIGTTGSRQLGQEVVTGIFAFEFLVDDRRFGTEAVGGVEVSESSIDSHTDSLAGALSLPVSGCSLPFDDHDLMPLAPRPAQPSGHTGLDFVCGDSAHEVKAAAGGQVVFVVRNREQPLTPERGDTEPVDTAAGHSYYWSNAMTLGNFVAINHSIAGTEEVVTTIYARMADIPDDISPGVLVDQGRYLGTAGSSGSADTSASSMSAATDVTGTQATGTEAIGTEATGTQATGTQVTGTEAAAASRSKHLHWELHIDNRPIVGGGNLEQTRTFFVDILCNPQPEGASPCTQI